MSSMFVLCSAESMAEAVLNAISKIGTVLGDEVINFVIAEVSKKVTNLRELPNNIKHTEGVEDDEQCNTRSGYHESQ